MSIRNSLTWHQARALDYLRATRGRWYEPVGSRTPYRELVNSGLAEGDGHGKFRATDDALREEGDEP